MKPEDDKSFKISPVRTNSLDSLQNRDEQALNAQRDVAVDEAVRRLHEEENKKIAQLWEKLDVYTEGAPRFVADIDKCWERYYENNKGNKDKAESLRKYDVMMSEIRQALASFTEDMQKAKQDPKTKDYSGAIMMESYIDLISDLCKKIYKIDPTFPDFKFLNEELFMQAVRKEVGVKQGEDMRIIGRAGRFTAVATKDFHFYLFDQQIQKVKRKMIENIQSIEKPRSGSMIVTYRSGDDLNGKKCLFDTETGEFSAEFVDLAMFGDLWIAKHARYYPSPLSILDRSGKVLYSGITDCMINASENKLLVRKEPFREYNVILEDGSLLLKDGGMKMISSTELRGSSRWNDSGYIHYNNLADIILERDGKFVRFNEDLEIVAEGSTLEEVELKEVA